MALSAQDPHVSRIDLTPDALPGNYLAKGACGMYHATAYDLSTPAVKLPNEPITWSTLGFSLSYNEASSLAPTTVTYLSSQAVAVCGKDDGFGSITVTASDGYSPQPFEVDVGQAAQTITIVGSTSLHDNAGPQPLTASATDKSGTVKDRTSRASWSSSNTAIASVSSITGAEWLTPHKAGTVTITATLYGVSGHLTVTVLGVQTVSVSPATGSVRIGATLQFTATPRDANGGAFSGKTITWVSSAPTVATVSTSGVVTGVAKGSVTISATTDGVTGTAAVTVTERLLTVSVDGPLVINTATLQFYTWTATASGGETPYSYRWEINYALRPGWVVIGGNSSSVRVGVSPTGGNFLIRATVTSGSGQQTAQGSLSVKVTGGCGKLIC
jgi:hypothetical protein